MHDIPHLFPASSQQHSSSRIVNDLEEYFKLSKELETAESLKNYAQTADKGGSIITGSISFLDCISVIIKLLYLVNDMYSIRDKRTIYVYCTN